METKRTNIADIYFHIGNGGISFGVIQSEYNAGESKTPLLQVSAHHFGQQTNQMEFSIRPEALRILGEMFIHASDLVAFENESQIVVRNPRAVRIKGEERLTGLAEDVCCSTEAM